MSSLEFITTLGKNISIRNKILLVILTVSNTVLFIVSTAVIIYSLQSDKNAMQQEMKVLANVIAARSAAALTFQDAHLAEENLHAFSEKETVLSACIYDNEKMLFAEYGGIDRQNVCSKSTPGDESGFIEDRYIEKKDILLDGSGLGSLYVTVSLDDIHHGLLRYIAIVALIFVSGVILAFILAIKLQKIITGPIDELANAARKIHHDKSYAIRVRKITNDEIGQLVVAFNDMLEGIEDRDLMLVDAKQNLEAIVRARTAALREAQSEVVRKDRMATLGQLTATVSHELRNPLGTIRTSMFTLFNRINKDESIKHIFERIDRNIVRCDSIITELLDYSRIRALQHQKTILGNWIKEVIEEIDIPDDISISMNIYDSVEAEIDRDLFRRVLVNVIDNAVQALNNTDKSVTNKTIIIESRANNNRTEIIITDTGPGIEKDILQRIFEPLFSTKEFGMGLGLSIVKQIMLQHGGNVDIDSEPDIGTRVVLWLPCILNDVSQVVPSAAKRGS